MADSKAERAADLAWRFSVPLLARDVGGLHRSGEVVVDDGEGPGIGIIDAALLGGERMHQHLVFDAVIGKRPGGVEAKRAQIAGQDLHGRDAARLDGLDELGAGREWEIFPAPEAEPLRIGEVVNRGRPGGRDIDHARIRQLVLQAQARPALLRGFGIATLALRPAALAMAWLSSKRMTPSKSAPSQSTIWSTRDFLAPRSSERSVA